LFIKQFYGYLKYDEEVDLCVDLDDIWEWMGFSRKDPAKRLLKKHFVLDENYSVTVPPRGEGRFETEKILMTIQTLKMMGMLANTEKGRNFRKYFLAMERVINQLVKESQYVCFSKDVCFGLNKRVNCI
jgi:phage anti-repressor protein